MSCVSLYKATISEQFLDNLLLKKKLNNLGEDGLSYCAKSKLYFCRIKIGSNHYIIYVNNVDKTKKH